MFKIKEIPNILKKASNLSDFKIMFLKLISRAEFISKRKSTRESLKWIFSNLTDFEELCSTSHPLIWEETLEASNRLEVQSKHILSQIPHKLGGGRIIIYCIS